MDTSLESEQRSLLSLVEGFVRRQALVLAALRDIRPDIAMRLRGEGDAKERATLTQMYYRSPQTGLWGDSEQWQYFVHGIGCRLIHVRTGEPIEWDAGDVRRFDRNWFLTHLVWTIQNNPNTNTANLMRAVEESGQSLQDFVFSKLAELHQAGVLSEPDLQYRYTLLTIDEPTVAAL